MSLFDEAAQAAELIEALRQIGQADEESVELTIASETSLVEAAQKAVAMLDEAQAMMIGIDARMEALKARKARLGARVERIRDELTQALEMAGQKRLSLPEATLFMQPGREAMRITDEDLLPPRFYEVKEISDINRRAILMASRLARTCPAPA